MSLRDKLGEYVPMLARKPALPREKSLALKPLRNSIVTWERKPAADEETLEGNIVLRVPVRQDRVSKLLTRLMPLPDSKSIELDEFGGTVWELCDGQHTVEQFVQQTCRKYQLNRRQAEVSIMAFLRMLLERRLIGFREADLKGNEHVSQNHARTPGRKRRQRPGHRRY